MVDENMTFGDLPDLSLGRQHKRQYYLRILSSGGKFHPFHALDDEDLEDLRTDELEDLYNLIKK